MEPNETKLRDTLRQLQRLAGVSFERKITHKDLSELAGVKKRVVDEWMRGAVQPPAMTATFELLSKLQLGDEIPEHLYRAIAQIIAFAYFLNGKKPHFLR